MLRVVRSARSFRVSARALNAEAAVDAGTADASSERQKSKGALIMENGTKWLQSDESLKFETLAPRNWLHPLRPFPKNPWFVPPVPVADAAREEIYSTYVSDPVKWTPRQLALKFELSVLRIEAILRLKHLEKKQIGEGYVVQKEFSKKMQDLLGVGTGAPGIQELVDARTLESSVIRPAFTTVDDESAVAASSADSTSSDASNAANATETMKLSEEAFKRRPDGNYIMELSGVVGPDEQPPTVLESENLRETNRRWNFLFADISQEAHPERRAMVVRQRDGSLRTATRSERQMQDALFPAHGVKQIRQGRHRAFWQI